MREFLRGLDLSKETIDTIMAEHGKLITRTKEDLETLKAQYDEANRKNAELGAKIAELLRKGDPDALKKQLEEFREQMAKELAAEREAHEQKLAAEREAREAERTAHESTKAAYATEKDNMDVDGKVAAALKEAGMNPAAIDKALKLYDRAIVKRNKDGVISNTDDVLKHFKGEWAGFFGETVTKGAEVATPPTNSTKPKYTLDDVKKMKPADINANWEKIKPLLEGN